MFQLDYTDRRPLYEQIKERLRALIIAGVIKEHQKVPSVRELAQSVTINPNTIQKAYRDLEAEGWIYSIQGKGSFVSPVGLKDYSGRKSQLQNELKKLVSELKFLHVPMEELLDLIKTLYNKKEDGISDD